MENKYHFHALGFCLYIKRGLMTGIYDEAKNILKETVRKILQKISKWCFFFCEELRQEGSESRCVISCPRVGVFGGTRRRSL